MATTRINNPLENIRTSLASLCFTIAIPCTARLQSDSDDTARFRESQACGTSQSPCPYQIRRYQGAAACIRTGGLRRLLVPTKFFPSPCRGIAAARRGASSHKFQRPICAELHSLQERLEQTQAAGVLRDERSHPASRLVPDRSFGSTG